MGTRRIAGLETQCGWLSGLTRSLFYYLHLVRRHCGFNYDSAMLITLCISPKRMNSDWHLQLVSTWQEPFFLVYLVLIPFHWCDGTLQWEQLREGKDPDGASYPPLPFPLCFVFTSSEKTTGLPHWDCVGIWTSDPHVLFRPGHNGTLSYLHLTCGRRVKKKCLSHHEGTDMLFFVSRQVVLSLPTQWGGDRSVTPLLVYCFVGMNITE